MTDQQHPGGVAGKYLDTTHLSPADTIGNARWHAKKELYDALSREARRILREDFDPKHRLYQYYTEVREAFELLGLDLESEDE